MSAAAVRRYQDAIARRLNEADNSRQIVATIATVTAGGAKDGNALVQVTWRGATLTVKGYAASYTPVVGHRVVCDYVDNQLIVAYRVVGQP